LPTYVVPDGAHGPDDELRERAAHEIDRLTLDAALDVRHDRTGH
jgi:hypothetical protein